MNALLNTSSIIEQSLQYMQFHKDERFTAGDIFAANNPQIDFNPQLRNLYESWLNEQVRKNRLMSTVGKYDIFGTKVYFLESWQKDYWQSHNWQV